MRTPPSWIRCTSLVLGLATEPFHIFSAYLSRVTRISQCRSIKCRAALQELVDHHLPAGIHRRLQCHPQCRAHRRPYRLRAHGEGSCRRQSRRNLPFQSRFKNLRLKVLRFGGLCPSTLVLAQNNCRILSEQQLVDLRAVSRTLGFSRSALEQQQCFRREMRHVDGDQLLFARHQQVEQISFA